MTSKNHNTPLTDLSAPASTRKGWRVMEYAGMGGIHLAGVCLTGVLLTWLVTDWHTMQTLWSGGFDTSGADMSTEMWRHGLYSVLVWGVIAGGVTLLRGKRREVRVMRLSRGQVMLETLLVIIPFLLLTGGLSQLIINNIAGMLSHLSAYEAGRTYWVWAQESERTSLPNPVGPDVACQRARLAAAASLAPVAGGPDGAMANDSQVNALSGIMAAQFSDLATAPGGSTMSSSPSAIAEAKSYADAFDTTPFGKRAAQKLRAAYANTQVVCPPPSGNMLTVEVTYHHFLSFPWFSYIFESGIKPGYTTYTRAYSLPLQASPE